MKLIRTNSENPGFIELVRQLDTYLAVINGITNDFYAQYNTIDLIQHVVVAFDAGRPVACGAIKAYGDDAMEVKRMYTLPEYRGKGAASAVLAELEAWAAEMAFSRCVLETGKALHDAVSLYSRNGYAVIPNYGQYEGVEDSVCFEKILAD